MHAYTSRPLSLLGIDPSRMSAEEMATLVHQMLGSKIHGVSFSPYMEGQSPGTELSDTQIRERLAVIQPHVRWIRTFSCTQGNEKIPAIATELGLKTMVGVWLGEEHDKNELELEQAIEVAKAGHAGILAVGNEVLLREDMSEDRLIDYIERARAAVPGIEVGYVDAYFKFVDYPRVARACDVILANCYPFWEGCPAEYSLLYMKEMYRKAQKAAEGKKVIISETGWPNKGSSFEGAKPGNESAIRYFINTYQWAEEEGVDVIYFSGFDESWKVEKEGDVGAFWGLWDIDGNLKY